MLTPGLKYEYSLVTPVPFGTLANSDYVTREDSQPHSPSSWSRDDPEACHRQFELVRELEDKRNVYIHIYVLSPNYLEDEGAAVLAYSPSADRRWLGAAPQGQPFGPDSSQESCDPWSAEAEQRLN